MRSTFRPIVGKKPTPVQVVDLDLLLVTGPVDAPTESLHALPF